MISRLKGLVEDKGKDELVVDIAGVGFRVFCSAQTLCKLPALGEAVSLRIRTLVREDAIDLYGFIEPAEEAMFMLLTSVSHIGPKVALGILSGIEVEALCAALQRGDLGQLTRLQGVGKKTAERLVVELKDKVSAVATGANLAGASQGAASQVEGDLISALSNLGYKENKARAAVHMALENLGEGAGMEALLKEALKHCRR